MFSLLTNRYVLGGGGIVIGLILLLAGWKSVERERRFKIEAQAQRDKVIEGNETLRDAIKNKDTKIRELKAEISRVRESKKILERFDPNTGNIVSRETSTETETETEINTRTSERTETPDITLPSPDRIPDRRNLVFLSVGPIFKSDQYRLGVSVIPLNLGPVMLGARAATQTRIDQISPENWSFQAVVGLAF